MTKKKSIWAFVLALCLIVPAMFMMTACGNKNKGGETEHTHTYSTEWTKNETHHWYAATCEHADEKGSYGEHVYDDDDDTTCNECGYVRTLNNDITFSIKSRTYNGNAQPLQEGEDYTVKFGTPIIEYKKKTENESAYSTTAPTNAGYYTVRISVPAEEGHAAAKKEADFIIRKKVLNTLNIEISVQINLRATTAHSCSQMLNEEAGILASDAEKVLIDYTYSDKDVLENDTDGVGYYEFDLVASATRQGQIAVTLSGGASENYELNSNVGKIKISYTEV